MSPFATILPAAGASSRFGGGRNKLLEPLAGKPVLLRTIETFLGRDDVPLIVVALSVPQRFVQQAPPALAAILRNAKVRLCAGGDCREQTVRNALALVPEHIEWVAVHDAARPLVSRAVIDRTLAAAVVHGAAVPALAVPLTIKQALAPLPARVQRTVPRQDLWAMQTPQIMRRAALQQAFDQCPIALEQVTDDAQLLELIGQDVWLVQGEERNLKITTALDLRIAQLLAEG